MLSVTTELHSLAPTFFGLCVHVNSYTAASSGNSWIFMSSSLHVIQCAINYGRKHNHDCWSGTYDIIYLHTLQRNEITSPQGNAARQRVTTVIRGTTYSPFFSSLPTRHFNVLVEHTTYGCCNITSTTDKTEVVLRKDCEICYSMVYIQHLSNM
jgi:hypothetical protein